MGEAVPDALVPAVGGEAVKPVIGPVIVIRRGVNVTRRDAVIARSIVGALGGSQPAAAYSSSDNYSCPAGYVYDPDYGCTLPGYAYEPYDYGYYGYSPYYGRYGSYYASPHRDFGRGFAHGMGGGFTHDFSCGVGHGAGFAHAGGGGFGHGAGGGHR